MAGILVYLDQHISLQWEPESTRSHSSGAAPLLDDTALGEVKIE